MSLPQNPGIYQLICKNTNKYYIGKALNIRDRMYGHKSGWKHCKSTSILNRAIKKYGWENFEIKILVEYKQIEDNVLLEIEEYYIKKYDATNRDVGYNIKKNNRDATWFKGIEHPCYGKSKFKESVEKTLKILENMPKEIPKSNWVRKRVQPVNCRPVKQIDMITNQILKIWNSSTEAAREFGRETAKATINSICRKIPTKGYYNKSCFGYFWQFADDNTPIEELCPFKVKQIDIETGNVVKIWKSPVEAALTLTGSKKRRSVISSACRKSNTRNHTAYGFKWEYV